MKYYEWNTYLLSNLNDQIYTSELLHHYIFILRFRDTFILYWSLEMEGELKTFSLRIRLVGYYHTCIHYKLDRRLSNN